MATDVEICSAALLQLGDAPIASLTENTNRARVAKNLYPTAKLAVLRSHTWNCATKRVQLAALAVAPVGGEWTHQFAKPGDLLRVLDVGTSGGDEYDFEGNRILYNGASLTLRYVAAITEGYFDALLTDVMVKRMAWDMAYPITKSTSLMEAKQGEFVRALREAKAIDGQETPPETYGDSPFLQVRGGPGSGD